MEFDDAGNSINMLNQSIKQDTNNQFQEAMSEDSWSFLNIGFEPNKWKLIKTLSWNEV